MTWTGERGKLAGLTALFLALYHLPLGSPRFQAGLSEALELTRWYAREHVVLCLLPAFFIAGAIGTFVRQESVMRHLGPAAPKAAAYGVASISGGILAVCSCTILPLFAGIWRMGAGLGPAVAFLYSGPAISALAVILTVAAIRRDRGVKWFAVPLAILGLFTSLWHILIEHRVVEESSACVDVQSCASPWRVSFGTLDFSTGTLVRSGVPITLAVMAFCGFAAILALLLTPEPLTLDQPEAEEDGQSSAG